MTQETVLTLAQSALTITLLLAAPALGLSLIVGLLVSIFQAVTQINEMTLTFIPKALAVIVSVIVFGPWMLNTLVAYSAGIFTQIATVGH